MSDYEPGDILIVRFPYEEDPTILSIRPALLLSVDEGAHIVCKITTTNRSSTNKGEWIHHESMIGKELGLKFDSFIDLDNIRHLKNSSILHHKSPIGEYRELNILLSRFGIEL